MILINSSLWDINRWGPCGHLDYKDNLYKLLLNVPEYTNMFYLTMNPSKPKNYLSQTILHFTT